MSRTSLQNWEEDSKESKHMKLSVVNVYKHIFSQIAVLLCGPAGSLSIAYALTNFRDVAQHALTLPLIRTIVRSRKSQKEPRVARAYLCGSTGRSKVVQLANVYKEFSLSNKTYVKGLSDFKKLTNGQQLSPPRRSLQRFDPAVVNQAIAFILGSDNVCHTSWGTKTIVVDGISRAFPLLMRKITRTNMYANYQKSTTVQKKREIQRSSFFSLASNLTHTQATLRKAVDYVTGFLVNDNLEIVHKLLETFTTAGPNRQRLLNEIEAANSYLKYGFQADTSKVCIAHNISVGLGCEETPTASPSTPTCSNCRKLFHVFHFLKEEILNSSLPRESALTALDGCLQKTQLFMGHRLRVLNQQHAIKKMQDEMMMNCLQNETVNECVILLDYKMKFEPVYFREKTVDHYGKRGISWHGAMITFYTVVAVDGVRTAVQNRYYMDHVVENESKQDITSVISILEAVIIGLKKMFPRLTTIYLQSDNASCYQNTMLLLLIPYLAFTYSLCIRRYIHTETQDGKSVLDAHFARCTQKVYEYCKEGN